MHKTLIGTSALLLVLGGCATPGEKPTAEAKPAEPAKPALSDEAKKAFADAEAAAKAAYAQHALWVPADAALKKAKEAAAAGQNDVVIKEAMKAMELIKLGEGQVDYVSTNKF
jgi:hypothetical protein